MITKPMLAGKAEDLSLLRFPLLATPKLDGIRCLKINGKALSRSFKPIANLFVREWIEANVPDGTDGELLVEGVPFSDVAGNIGKRTGEPDFRFYAFDYVTDSLSKPYAERMKDLEAAPALDRVVKILPTPVNNLEELMELEAKWVDLGYEGIMVRTPESPYKTGRSTQRESYLLKIKRFEDAEAIVLACIEGQTNLNEAQLDAFGHTKRSSAKDGKVGRGTLGALRVRDVVTGCEFKLSGFPREMADAIWADPAAVLGKPVTYKHQPSGAKDAPRFPKFKAFRETWDMDPASIALDAN